MSRLSRLFDSSPRTTAILGAVLLAAGLALLALTGRADRLRVAAEDALGGFVMTGTAARPGPAANGKLVLVVGTPEVQTPASDPQFGVSVDALALVRRVEMFQWNQTGSGADRGYETGWFDHPIDSARFSQPTGHVNPGAFPIGAARFDAPDVKVAGFTLAPPLVGQVDGPESFRPNLGRLPPNMAATFAARDGTLVTTAGGARPQVGDLRISWEKIAPTDLTVFARDEGGTLVPASRPDGAAITQVMIGRHGLTDVLPDAPRRPRLAWARRILAVLLAWAGVACMLPRPRHRDAVLSLAIALVPLAVVAAVGWFGVRAPVFAAMVVVAVFAAVAAGWRWRAHHA